jgi:hypothetical protein
VEPPAATQRSIGANSAQQADSDHAISHAFSHAMSRACATAATQCTSRSRGGEGGLSAFGASKHVLWLPGGADWSSALNRLMAVGSTWRSPHTVHALTTACTSH